MTKKSVIRVRDHGTLIHLPVETQVLRASRTPEGSKLLLRVPHKIALLIPNMKTATELGLGKDVWVRLVPVIKYKVKWIEIHYIPGKKKRISP